MMSNKFEFDEEECFKEESVYDKLDWMIKDLSDLRDFQNEITCKPNGCICEQFDLVIDELQSLRDKFGRD